MRLGAGLLIAIAAGGYLLLRRHRSGGAPEAAAPGPALRPEAVEPSPDANDVFAVLRAEHEEIKGLQAAVRASREGERDDHGEEAAAVARLVASSSRHDAVEEMHFWPAVRARLEDGDRLTDRGLAEEVELRRTLHTLERRRPDSPDWADLLETFFTTSYDHLVFEEVHVWPPLSRSMDRRARSELGAALLAARGDAPTRPHVSALATPGRHRRLGRAIGLFDRWEDRRANRTR